MILQLVFSLLIFSLSEHAAVNGQCSTPPLNLAKNEGTQNCAMACSSPTKVAWSVVSTTDALNRVNITYYDDVVDPTLTNLYGVNQTHLLIKAADSKPTTGSFATSGLYVVAVNGSTTKFGAKLVVVRQPPACACKAINATSVQLDCNAIFADSDFNPISANLTWTSNGNYYTSSVAARTRSNDVFLATSSITISSNDQAKYQCYLTFTSPNGLQYPYVSTNAPDYSANCTSPYCGVTTTTTTTTTPPTTTATTLPTIITSSPLTTVAPYQCSPLNLAVNEGAQYAAVACRYPTKVAWSVIPTSDELSRYNVTYYNDVVDPSLANLYGVNQTHLLIKTAQSSPGNQPISTSGLYVIAISGSTPKFGAKLLVVRKGPTCDCRAFNSSSVQLTCNVTFADSTFNPISANMTWTSNGNYYTSSVVARTRSSDVFLSTSSITISNIDQAVYRCNLSFTKPDGIQLSYVATNAPEYSAFCTSPYCGLTTTTTTTSTTTPATTIIPPTSPTVPRSTFPLTTFPTPPSTTTTYLTTACNCPQRSTTACPTPGIDCTTPSECQQDDTNLTAIYDECVVQAELYVRRDNCCSSDFICGVVVTIRDDSRWLIHDAPCTDNKCQMVAVNATCMSNTWKLLDVKKVTASGVGDYVKAGNGLSIWQNATDCSETCKRMMILT